MIILEDEARIAAGERALLYEACDALCTAAGERLRRLLEEGGTPRAIARKVLRWLDILCKLSRPGTRALPGERRVGIGSPATSEPIQRRPSVSLRHHERVWKGGRDK